MTPLVENYLKSRNFKLGLLFVIEHSKLECECIGAWLECRLHPVLPPFLLLLNGLIFFLITIIAFLINLICSIKGQ